MVAFHPRLENPRGNCLGDRRTYLQLRGIGNSEGLQGGWGMAKKISIKLMSPYPLSGAFPDLLC